MGSEMCIRDRPNFYHYMSAVDNLAIAARIKGVVNPDIEGALRQVNLLQRKDSRFQTYSLGMKQRLAIASCLIGNPEVMVFDEPTNGLDPAGIAEIRDLIKQLAAEGKTIIMASHLLDEVEKVCSHVAIIKKGDLIAAGHVNEILVNEDIVEISTEDMEMLRGSLGGLPSLQKTDNIDGNCRLFIAAGTADTAAINRYFFERGITLSSLALKKKSLESKFIELTNEQTS